MLVEVFGQAVSAVLGAGEDQHLLPGALGDQVGKQGALVAGRQAENALLDALDRRVRRRDLDAFGFMQQLAGEIGDVFGEGRRKQQVLAFARQPGEDLLDVVDEAHVEHAVGFIKDQDFDVRQVDGLLVGQVEQSARTGDEYVEALGDRLDLRVHADAAKYAGALKRQVAGVDLETVMNLRGEFARRGQDQHAWLSRAMAMGGIGMTARKEDFQHREGKATGLAGSRLCGDHQVASLQHGGNGPLLHRCRLGIAGGLDGSGQSLGETEGSKGHE